MGNISFLLNVSLGKYCAAILATRLHAGIAGKMGDMDLQKLYLHMGGKYHFHGLHVLLEITVGGKPGWNSRRKPGALIMRRHSNPPLYRDR